jgi:hypothetical protein
MLAEERSPRRVDGQVGAGLYAGRMAEGERWLGRWRRPDSDSDVGGELVFEDGRIQLTLFGSLVDWSRYDVTNVFTGHLDPQPELRVIHGRTLSDVSVLKARCRFPIHPHMEGNEGWSGEAIVEGRVDAPIDGSEPVFDGLRLRLHTLPAWARARAVKQSYVWADDPHVEIAAREHELASGTLSSNATVRIKQSVTTTPGDRALTVRQPVWFEVRTIAGETWGTLRNRWLQPLQVILWLATGEPATVEHMELPVPDGRSPARLWWYRLWAPLLEPRHRSERRLLPDDVMFHADELPGGFAAGFDRWLSIWSDLQHVIGPLHARAVAPFAYANDHFYTAAAAIEAYHRYCVDSESDLPREQHRQRVDRLSSILAAAAPDLHDWAVNAVRPFNRVPWWRRMVHIAECIPHVSAALFGERVEPFAKVAEATRHGEAHALEGARELDEGFALVAAARALTWLLRTCILVDLGFEIEMAQSRVLRHVEFRTTCEWTLQVLDSLQSSSNASGPPL